jgi:hypothetical protein
MNMPCELAFLVQPKPELTSKETLSRQQNSHSKKISQLKQTLFSFECSILVVNKKDSARIRGINEREDNENNNR